jgi:hypothetical protein
MKRVTERRRDDLGKCGAQRTCGIGETRTDTGLMGADLGEMADLVNDGALLRNQEQQQKAERFERLSHSNVSDEFTGPREKLPERHDYCRPRAFPATGVKNNTPSGLRDR